MNEEQLKKLQEEIQEGERSRYSFGKTDTEMADGEKNSIRVLVSSERLNRRKLVVMNSAYNLKDFLRHPVLLASHGRYALDDIIGRWSKMEVTDKGLYGTAEYFMDRPKAMMAWDLVQKGLAAYSIGFNVRQALFGKQIAESKDIPRRIKNKDPWVVFTEIDLEEVSQCVIPVNADAVLHHLEENPDARELIELAKEQGLYGDVDPFAKQYAKESEEEKDIKATEEEAEKLDKKDVEELAEKAKELEEKVDKMSESIATSKSEAESIILNSELMQKKLQNRRLLMEGQTKLFMVCNNIDAVHKEWKKVTGR